MALGIQRNDAAGFVKASRILADNGKGHLVPSLDSIDPPPPIIASQREIKTIAVLYHSGGYFEQPQRTDQWTEYIRRKLADEMARKLLDLGLCRITATQAGPSPDSVVFRATIDVAVPQEVAK
jgi:hypothetical protein